jgi:alkylated DNA repair protein (DNA oxidative demethylase)
VRPSASLFPLPAIEPIAEDVILLRGFAEPRSLLGDIARLSAAAPFRHLQTRGGFMSVAMTSCGRWGWYSDLSGYRYVERDPLTERPWPAMPAAFRSLARRAAECAGFAPFDPDACLVNRYAPGARMGTHRDFDEQDLRHPIVSVSIGLPATFLWYGERRSGAARSVRLETGDVLVWGRSARAGYHAVRPVGAGEPAAAHGRGDAAPADAGGFRYNLTFRRAK